MYPSRKNYDATSSQPKKFKLEAVKDLKTIKDITLNKLISLSEMNCIFGKTVYLATGSPLSSILAEAFLNHLKMNNFGTVGKGYEINGFGD